MCSIELSFRPMCRVAAGVLGVCLALAVQSQTQAQCLLQDVPPESLDTEGFGRSLSFWDGRLLVGDEGIGIRQTFSGGGHTYRYINGIWQFEQTILPIDAANDAEFGFEVSLSEGHAAIGHGSAAGQVYLFDLVGGFWQQVQVLERPEDSSGYFGRRVSLRGSTLFVSDPQYVELGQIQGAVFVYEHVKGAWTLSTILRSPSYPPNSTALFGLVIDFDGARAVIGGNRRAYVFERASEGDWVVSGELAPPEITSNPSAVKIDGTTACVSYASFSQASGVSDAVHLYGFADGVWSLQQTLTAPNLEHNFFGSSLDLLGDRLAVLRRSGQPSQVLLDSVELYRREAGRWNLAATFALGPTAPYESHGRAIEILPHGVAVGPRNIEQGEGVRVFDEINTQCLGDTNGDSVIDGADLAILLGSWGTSPSCADLVTSATFAPTPDGLVDGADLAYLLSKWGACE